MAPCGLAELDSSALESIGVDPCPPPLLMQGGSPVLNPKVLALRPSGACLYWRQISLSCVLLDGLFRRSELISVFGLMNPTASPDTLAQGISVLTLLDLEIRPSREYGGRRACSWPDFRIREVTSPCRIVLQARWCRFGLLGMFGVACVLCRVSLGRIPCVVCLWAVVS